MTILFGSNAIHAATLSEDNHKYRNALTLNDQGRGAEALALLAGLREKYPNVLRYRYDYAAIASASGEHAATLSAINEHEEGDVPHYVLKAIFRSALALPDETRAERLRLILESRFGSEDEPGNGIQLCYLNLKLAHYEKALALSAQLLERFPQRLDVLDLRAYTLRQSGRPSEALLVYQTIQQRFPEDAESKKAIGMILADLGSPRLSTETLKSQAPHLEIDETLRLDKDRGAQYLRWAAGDPDEPGKRFRNTDLAIATLRQARADALTNNGSPEILLRIRSDLILAYHARHLWAEAIGEFESLLAEGLAVPEEVQRAGASSYAMLGRFEEAEPILRKLVAETPDSYELVQAWIYLLADLERFDEAQQASAELIAALKRTDLGNPAKAEAYTSARITEAMLRAYRSRYAEAQKLLDKLQEEAPGSLDTTEALGILARWQDLPRKAEEQFSIVLGEQPDRVESRLGAGNARLDRGTAADLRQTVNELDPDYAAQINVRDARRRLELRDGYYVTGDATFGSDQYSVEGNRSREFDLKTYSRPLGDGHWRAFARDRYLSSGPAVDTADNNFSVGAQHRTTDWTTEIEAGAGGYARLTSDVSLTDQWSSGVSIERNLFFRQSQAVATEASANAASLSLRWRRDENLDIGTGYTFTDFSNNQRSEAFLVANRNLYRDYDRRVNVSVRVSGQSNSNPDVAYFSPSRRLEASGTLSFEIRQWQDLATKKSSLWHHFWLTAGGVNQQGFATDAMNSVGYGQEIALTDAFAIRWSITRSQYPYDGVKSVYYTGRIGFEGYF